MGLVHMLQYIVPFDPLEFFLRGMAATLKLEPYNHESLCMGVDPSWDCLQTRAQIPTVPRIACPGLKIAQQPLIVWSLGPKHQNVSL